MLFSIHVSRQMYRIGDYYEHNQSIFRKEECQDIF